MFKISHMIYYPHRYNKIWMVFRDPSMPFKFHYFLAEKWAKFKDKFEKSGMPFTVGCDEEAKIWAIAICHPRDMFSLKIGEQIVKGRIERMQGKIRKPYNPIPPYVFIKKPKEDKDA